MYSTWVYKFLMILHNRWYRIGITRLYTYNDHKGWVTYIYMRNTPGMDGDLMKISWRPAPECANGNILSMVQTMDWGYLLQHFNDTELPHFFSQEQRRWKTARDMDSWCEMTYWLDTLHGKSLFLIGKSLFLMGNHYFK